MVLLGTSNLLRFLMVVIVVLASVFVLAVCGDGFDEVCSNLRCTGADRSRPTTRIVATLCGAFSSGLSFALRVFTFAARGLVATLGWYATALASPGVSALRI